MFARISLAIGLGWIAITIWGLERWEPRFGGRWDDLLFGAWIHAIFTVAATGYATGAGTGLSAELPLVRIHSIVAVALGLGVAVAWRSGALLWALEPLLDWITRWVGEVALVASLALAVAALTTGLTVVVHAACLRLEPRRG